ncbi:hypothetical protein Tco_1243250 [Tanacetum coccineum]
MSGILPPPPVTSSRNAGNLNRVEDAFQTDNTNNTDTNNVAPNVVNEDLPQLLDSRRGSLITNVPAFDVDDFTNWKDRYELIDFKNTKAYKLFLQNKISRLNLDNESLRNEVFDLKKVIEKWTSSKGVTFIVPVSVISEPSVLTPIPKTPSVSLVTTLLPPPSVSIISHVLVQSTTPIPTPPITTKAPSVTMIPDPLHVVIQRVFVLEKDVQELKEADNTTTLCASLRSEIPSAFNAYL